MQTVSVKEMTLLEKDKKAKKFLRVSMLVSRVDEVSEGQLKRTICIEKSA